MGNAAGKTEDGFEIQLGTNHVGHFLLTKLLLPTLQKTVARARAQGVEPDVRVVSVSSAAHAISPSFEDITSTPSLLKMSTWHRYGASKAANIFFAAELARRYPEILSVSVHPGAVNSDLYAHAKASGSGIKFGLNAASSLFFRGVGSGALNTLWAASAPRSNLVNGAYYSPVGYRCGGTAFVQDADVAQRLWDWTETEISERS